MDTDKLKNIRDNQPVYKATKKNVLYMLRESNLIEGVEGKTALTQARRAWDYVMMYDSLNNQIVKETHRILMEKQPIERKYRGDWRDVPVSIGGQIKSQSKPVLDSLMRDWCKKTNTVGKNFDPVTLHIDFENIHPFIDGNGRMGRILLNWHLVKRNNSPLLIYTYEDRRTYYRLFASYRNAERAAMWDRILPYMEEMKKRNAADL